MCIKFIVISGDLFFLNKCLVCFKETNIAFHINYAEHFASYSTFNMQHASIKSINAHTKLEKKFKVAIYKSELSYYIVIKLQL